MKLSTGLPLFNTPVDPQGTENQPSNAIFHAGSKSLTSHIIDVTETPIVVKAYGFLNDASTITVHTVTTGIGNATYSSPMVINGRTVQLSKRNNTLVLDLTGKYKFVLSDNLGVTTCVYHESGLSLWSFGLSQFAELNGMLQFVETETIKPVMEENQVKLYIKISSDSSNLIQARNSPLIADDPIGPVFPPDVSGHTDEFDIGGLYYGLSAPPNFQNQYVSSSTGSNDPAVNNGSRLKPWKSIQYAINNLPDGTIGNIYLLAGDTFYTYLPNPLTDAEPAKNPGTGVPLDQVEMATYKMATDAIQAQKLQVGNKQIFISPYGDTAIDDIKAYNTTWGTGFNAYVARETLWPTIRFVHMHVTATNQIIPASMALGIAGAWNFSAVNLYVPDATSVPLAYVNGCMPGNGAIAVLGGNIFLGNVPLLGNGSGGGAQTFAENHLQIKPNSTTVNPRMNISGTQLSINSAGYYEYDGTLIVPAGAGGGPGLSYTDNADNTENYLTPLSFWVSLVIYDAPTRDAAGVVTSNHVSGSDLRSYRRVKTDIRIVDPLHPAP